MNAQPATTVFRNLVAQLHGDDDTRWSAAAKLLRDYNLGKHPEVKGRVLEILGTWQGISCAEAQLVANCHEHPQISRWQD